MNKRNLLFASLLLLAGCATQPVSFAPVSVVKVAAVQPRALALATPLLTPTYYTITNPAPKVSLAWDAQTAGMLFNLYYGVSSASYTNQTAAGTNTALTITLPSRGATYYFAATAIDPVSLLESPFSLEVTFTPTQPPARPNLHPPVVLVVESKSSLADALWADAGMNWSFDPAQTNAVFRLRVVASQ